MVSYHFSKNGRGEGKPGVMCKAIFQGIRVLFGQLLIANFRLFVAKCSVFDDGNIGLGCKNVLQSFGKQLCG